MADFVKEGMARRQAIAGLRTAQRSIDKALTVLYDDAPGYAGEVESVKEATANAIRVLNGEPPE